jgi:hypothetical protein
MRFILALALVAGCRVSQVQNCGDGFLCPAGQVCAPGQDLCVAPEQLTACQAMADGTMCSFANTTMAACKQGVCTPMQSMLPPGTCGNGMLDPGETCDGAPPAGQSCLDYGFDAGRLGCSSSCGPDLSGCRRIGWTAMKLPQPLAIQALFGTNAGDVWANAGSHLFHYDGNGWADWSLPSGAQSVGAMWGATPSDFWAVLDSVLQHWDGHGWAPGAGGMAATAIWGPATNDFYFSLGDSIFHSDGTSAQQVYNYPSGAFTAIWGSSASDVFAVGAGGWVVHYDGKTWTPTMVDTFKSVWGSGPHDVWAAGPNGVNHYDGMNWVQSTTGPYESVWGSGPSDVFAVGSGPMIMPVPFVSHWDGSTWTRNLSVLQSGFPHAIWGSGPSDLFLAGDSFLLHGQGSDWHSFTGPVGGNIGAISAVTPNDVWIAGNGGLMQYSYGQFVPPNFGTQLAANGVWATTGKVFATGCMPYDCGQSNTTGGILIGDGASNWMGYAVPSGEVPLSVVGVSASEVYVATNKALYEWDGTQFGQTPFTETPTGPIWAAGSNDLFVAVAGGVTHFKFGVATDLPFPAGSTRGAKAIWGASASDVWIADLGQLAHWDGTKVDVTPFTNTDLRALWGTSSSDVFAGGALGTLLHFDGTVWTPVRLPATGTLQTIAGFASGVWMGGTAFMQTGLYVLERTWLAGP